MKFSTLAILFSQLVLWYHISYICFHISGSPNKSGERVKNYATFGAKSVSGAAIYYMGIVDFLQDWTTRKKVERMTKVYLLGQEAEGTSVMHPDPYKVRFQNKMDEIFDLELLESRRRKKMKNKFKHGVRQVISEKKRISGRAFAPAGTTLNKSISRNKDGMVSVGVVDTPESQPAPSVDVEQRSQPFGSGRNSPMVTNNRVSFGNVPVNEATPPRLSASTEIDSAGKSRSKHGSGKKSATPPPTSNDSMTKRVFEEFTDVDI